MKGTKRKILAFGIILSMLFAMATMPASAAQSGTCGANLTWTLDNSGTLTISGTGNMSDYSGTNSPWFASRESIKSVIIGSGVTSIGRNAFSYCTNLPSVSIPDSVTSIGATAFTSCTSLTAITVSQNNPNYSSEAGVLFNKDKTTLIRYPCGKTGNYYIIPDSVIIISYQVFNSCTNLKSVTIPDGVTSIMGASFSDCSSLTSITIPDSVTSIDDNAFWASKSLADVYYGGSPSQWSAITIGASNSALTGASIHYNCIASKTLTETMNNSGGTKTILDGGVFDIGEELYYRNGYVNASEGYIKSGDKKITGSNIHFTDSGKIRLDAGDTAKIEEDNGNGTTTQGFIAGLTNPNATVTVTLVADGTVDEADCTGKTITEEFDFSGYEIGGLVNFGFAITNIPNTVSLAIQSVE